jgi:hypothetical protein
VPLLTTAPLYFGSPGALDDPALVVLAELLDDCCAAVVDV